MRVSLIAFLLASLISAAPPHNDNSTAWGEVSSGLRLGIGLGPVSPEPQLRLVFENMGKIEIPVLLGAMTGKGAVYNLTFLIKSPGGQESDLFNFNGPPGIAGSAEPIIAHIAKGQKYEILAAPEKIRRARKRQEPDSAGTACGALLGARHARHERRSPADPAPRPVDGRTGLRRF